MTEAPVRLQTEQLAALRTAGRSVSYGPSYTIFVEGEPSDCAVIIVKGLVKLTCQAATGYVSMPGIRGAGELIGEFGCIDGKPRSATVTTMTKVDAILIPSSRFRRVLEQQPAIAFAVLTITIARLRESDRRRLESGAYPATERAVRMLLELVDRHGEAVDGHQGWVLLRTSQIDLARVAGVSRETVGRMLRKVSGRGVVSTRRGVIIVQDLAMLHTIVSDGSV